jgi:hypothetical protein
MSVLAKAAAMVSTKGAAGLAVALLAVGAAAVATEASVTGSANPTNWGQTVVKQVDACKNALGTSRNVGQCVSAVAKTHGATVRSEHSDQATSHASGPRLNQPNGQPTNKTGGRPSNVPPTSHP